MPKCVQNNAETSAMCVKQITLPGPRVGWPLGIHIDLSDSLIIIDSEIKLRYCEHIKTCTALSLVGKHEPIPAYFPTDIQTHEIRIHIRIYIYMTCSANLELSLMAFQ
jgi:hypothetical protein